MNEIFLDTETTGLSFQEGHKIVEIACIETQDLIPTNKIFHTLINPERDMPEEAFAIHGLSTEFLLDKPKFKNIVDEFLEFIADAPLVIHNAEFDLRFIDSELLLLEKEPIERSRSVDTVKIARRRYPGAQVSLDALCRRFEIDLSRRDKHGALLDAELLAEVYLYLMGGRQRGLDLNSDLSQLEQKQLSQDDLPVRLVRSHLASAEELDDHEALLDQIKDPIWRTE